MPDVLIVDDDATFVHTCAVMLRRDGYAVQTADSVRTAIARLDDGRPSAMLLDWKLSDGTALDVLRWSASRRYRVPTALLTGFWLDPDFEQTEAAARRLGVGECIRRGVDFEEPAEIVRRLLDPLWLLHKALVAGDEAACDTLARELSVRVRSRLQARFPLADADLIDGAVFDVAADYLREPSRFQPARHASIESFAYTLARRIVWNSLRAQRRRRSREEEYARLCGQITAPDLSDRSHGRSLIERALAQECDQSVRAAIRAWLDGERGHDRWFEITSILVLPVAERYAAIERCKDAFRIRVKRLAKASRKAKFNG